MLAVEQLTELISELNVRVPVLREITNQQDHDQALALMEELIEDYDTNLVAIEALSNSIARYEADAVSFSEFNQRGLGGDPAVATLKVLMDQHNLNTTDFKNEIGGKSMVSQVLSGGKRLTRDHIERLAMRFGLSPALFFK
ncbi:helix-turn-helix domain-containing protein [Ningiella sp. W23]|uniref:helix-turn-helix domain-containing protein n=1 Tax=Ningiella sp. W23 TaxID=3023715 RepID=UPI0037571775